MAAMVGPREWASDCGEERSKAMASEGSHYQHRFSRFCGQGPCFKSRYRGVDQVRVRGRILAESTRVTGWLYVGHSISDVLLLLDICKGNPKGTSLLQVCVQ